MRVRLDPGRLLHVEDDAAQHRFIAHQLNSVAEIDFDIRCAESESDAVVAFAAFQPGFVILDYHLADGNGLSCLRTFRARDGLVPIIAVSGVATAEIAAQLMKSGADDYIGKQELTCDVLARSVRRALARSDALRTRIAARRSQTRAAMG